MANVSKILQTVGKGIKYVANSKASKAVGKGLNTIFTPVRKAHQAQGLKSIKDFLGGDTDSVSGKYILTSLGAAVTMLGTCIGAIVIDKSSDKHFVNNREKYEKQRLISSKLLDTALGLLGGLILGGPIGSIILGGTMAAIPKDITHGKEEMWSCGETIHTYNDVRDKHRAARKEARSKRGIDKETLENIPRMVPGNSSFKPDTVKRQTIDTAIDVNTAKKPADTIVINDTGKKEETVKQKTVSVDNKSEEVKSEEKTNFWNGELNEIETETINVKKGDCLWNIAKRELQKVNDGKRITNAQIVKQVKEFGRLNPELFGENPSYESLDYIKEGAILKLSA